MQYESSSKLILGFGLPIHKL